MSSRSDPAASVSVLKASPAILSDALIGDEERWRRAADHYVRHEFSVLGSGWVRVHYGMQCKGFEDKDYSDLTITAESILCGMAPVRRQRSEKLLGLARHFVPGYVPIDWHIDFKSGYRYPLLHHSQLMYGLVEGVDAKVSADLSRCYHLVVLALAWRSTDEERYRQEILAHILDWLAFNPFQYGPAWRANMNVSIRVVNWIVAFSIIQGSLNPASGPDRVFLEAFRRSLLHHRRHIADNLEFPEDHVHPNHYIANLAGLVVASAFSQHWDPEASAWRNLALRELRMGLDRQVMKDGFDFEAATSYHALVLEMISYALILAARADDRCEPAAVRNWIEAYLGQDRLINLRDMFIALRDITQPDGLIPLIGDSDDGRFLYLETPLGEKRNMQFLSCVGAAMFEDSGLLADTHPPLDWTAARLLLGTEPLEGQPAKPRSAAYPATGFYVMRGPAFYSLITCGPIGTAGKGGHCHNDKLSLTLCIEDKEILVDPGVYVYTASKTYRNLYRSVFAHNTVGIAGREQNRFLSESPWWGCHEDTRCRCMRWERLPDRDIFMGEHRGYMRTDPPMLHRRRVEWQKAEDSVTITDEILGEDESEPRPQIEVTFMMHPDCQVAIAGERLAAVERDGVQVSFLTSGGQWELGTGLYSPSYGVKEHCPKLVLRLAGPLARNVVVISW